MKLSDLSGNPRNPRRITDEKKEMLKTALMQFGDISGIVFNKRTNQLVGGHQRKDALGDGVIEIVKTYEEPTKTGTVSEGFVVMQDGEKFIYREVDWDEKTEIAANIAANKGAGEWDYGLLTEYLNELDHANVDLNLTMFDQVEIERLLGGWGSDSELIDKIEEDDSAAPGIIKISCNPDDKDEVLIFIKSKLLETSFEGIHVE